MASFLRQIVAGPRARHSETGLDLCYVTDNIIATSGPSGTYPQLAYRNSLKELVKYLDSKHGDQWAIWEFRAEGTGYADNEVYGRINHFPWPDHHPPPFRLIPSIMTSMHAWLSGEQTSFHQISSDNAPVDTSGDSSKSISTANTNERVAVVHCKAGKGRSGTIATSYLISHSPYWTKHDALQRFTERRMRPLFGNGITIPSQLRWVDYVERWTSGGKHYTDSKAEVKEIHVWGLRDGVKVFVRGFKENGKRIEIAHEMQPEETDVVRKERLQQGSSGIVGVAWNILSQNLGSVRNGEDSEQKDAGAQVASNAKSSDMTSEATGDVIFRPKQAIVLETSDINIDFERRVSGVPGVSMVTSVAHVWFNTFFEGNGPENREVKGDRSGVFQIVWDDMDGIKGSYQKGVKGFDRMAVVWQNNDHNTEN